MKSLAHYTKNKRPNFNEYTIAMEKNEWEKDLMEEFTRLVQQLEELKTVNIGTREDKK